MIAAILAAKAAFWLLCLVTKHSGTNGHGASRLKSAPLPELTPRENEALRLLAEGLSNVQIAQTLGISEHTVRAHIYSIYSKLNVNRRVQAARFVTGYGDAA